MVQQGHGGERRGKDQDGEGVTGDRRRERPRGTRLRHVLASRREETKTHNLVTKSLGGETSRAATGLRAELSNREQEGAISSKCDGGAAVLACPGGSAARSEAEWCAAEPGPPKTVTGRLRGGPGSAVHRSAQRSRACPTVAPLSVALHAAPHPGHDGRSRHDQASHGQAAPA